MGSQFLFLLPDLRSVRSLLQELRSSSLCGKSLTHTALTMRLVVGQCASGLLRGSEGLVHVAV